MTAPYPRLHGRRLAAARLAWLAVTGLVLVLAAGTVPDFIREASTIASAEQRTFSQLSPAEVQVLEELGLSTGAYVAFLLAWVFAPLFVFIFVASLIFQRRSDDPAAFLISLMLVAIGAAAPYLSGITEFRPAWQPAVHFVRALGAFLLLLLLFLFPDGRFVPRWTRLVALLWAGWMLYWLAFPNSPWGFVDRGGALTPVSLVFVLLGFSLGLYAQAYRYRSISTSIQRQQAKVFAFGFAGTFALYMAAVIPYQLVPVVQQPGWPYLLYGLIYVPLLTRLALVFIPLVIGFAILRYHLWDIDLIIRRTLIYGVLTSALALVYLGTVLMLQQVLSVVTGQRQSELPTVVSTLAIAALFGPLRGRVQNAIDRRFYRRKYDAAKALAAFSDTVLEDVDANRLTEQLLNVVADTLQPAHLSLWLKAAPGPAARGQGTER